MAIVGYLLGAGASAQCIPVVNGMSADMSILIKELKSFYPSSTLMDSAENERREKYLKITKVLVNLEDICSNYYSIDTYAKKLFLTDKKGFSKLKLDLSLYFTLRQILSKPDKRYDNFFASIISSENKLPASIKLISWNYDFQLEKSYLDFGVSDDIDYLRSFLGIVSPKDWEGYKKHYNKFNIIKLNGSAKIETREYEGFMFSSLTSPKNDIVHEVIDRYIKITDHTAPFKCDIKFAWENEDYEKLFEEANPELKSITVLVIIGYSFPFFNREVDMALFDNMPNLKKIYIQDKNPENIKETMEEFIDLTSSHRKAPDVIFKRNLDQFVFPKELNVTF